MSIRRRSSVYLFLAILIIVGIFIFIFRQTSLSYLSHKVFGEGNGFNEMPVKASKNASLDLDLLEKKEFQVLNNQVNYFDFDVVGKPVAQNSLSANLPKWPKVYRGNFNPFIKVPIKEIEANIVVEQ